MRPLRVLRMGSVEKVLVPLQVFAFASRVEEAAVIVMFVVPSKEVPLMVRAVWSWVAVFALPPIERVVVEIKEV
jgi:hypothetical protein